jgi:hypothetical protein
MFKSLGSAMPTFDISAFHFGILCSRHDPGFQGILGLATRSQLDHDGQSRAATKGSELAGK